MALLDFCSMIHSTTASCDVLPMEKPGAAAHSAKHAITRGWLVGSLRRPSLVAHITVVVEICRHFLETVCCCITCENP